MNLSAGCIVEFSSKGSQPDTGVVLSAAGNNVRVLLLNGKETNIQEKKILHTTTRSVTSVSDREACRHNLITTNEQRQQVMGEIDLAELHELLVDDIRPYSLVELAEFLFAPDDDNSAAALLRKLAEDRIYFKSKNDAYHPASAEELEQALLLQQRREAQENEETQLCDALKKLDTSGEVDEALNEHLASLKYLAAGVEEHGVSKRMLAALDKNGLHNPRKLFQGLVKAQVMGPDENLAIIRHKLPVDFSDAIVKEAERLIALPFPRGQRQNLTALTTWAIDTEGSKDRDDAFSFEERGSEGYRLLVHIADPAELIIPDSPIDKEAARRGSSVYMPDNRVHMLPAAISEKYLSLDEGGERLAITFSMDFSPECTLQKLEVFESIIQMDRALDYESADKLAVDDAWLGGALAFAEKLKGVREANGAVMVPRQPELSIKVCDGEIVVEQRNRDDMTQGMIAEFMVWTNHAAAEWFRENSVPCLFRMQDGEKSKIEFGDTFNPVVFFSALKTFRKTVISPNAGRHHSLGLNSYTQVTSPLRRYSDLLLHRQIKAFLHTGKPAYSQDELGQAMMVADISVGRADEIMRDRDRYFLLKYLKQQQKNQEVVFDGVIVETSLAEVTFYADFLCSFRHCRKPAFDVAVGQKVLVKVNQIDLFDGIIRFDIRQPA